MSSTERSSTAHVALVQAAIRLLTDHGPEAVKARTVTSEADLTTMALYTSFGGMSGLMSAVCEEGFARLDAQMRAVEETDDPVADLFALAVECRKFAVENPYLYDLIFGLPSRGAPRGELLDGEQSATRGATAYQLAFATLTHACDRVIASGRVRSTDGRRLAAQLWSLVHGYVSLELSGHFSVFDDPVNEVFVPLTVGFMTGQGDDRDESMASTTKVTI